MRAAKLIFAAVFLAVPATALGQAPAEAEAAIAEGNETWEAGWSAADAARIASVYADDAVVLAPGAEALEGREAIQAALASILEAAGGSQMAIETLEVMSHGDVVIDRGSFVERAADGSHKDHGKYMAVWKKIDGSWKIVRDIWNSSMTP